MSTKRALATLLIVCLTPVIATTQVFTVTDLGPLTPTGINTWGQVVGDYNNHAYMWTSFGGMKDLGLLPGGTFSVAAAINDRGMVTGTASGPGIDPIYNVPCSEVIQPFLWTQKDGMIGLGVINADTSLGFEDCDVVAFTATDINVRGQIIGYTQEAGTIQWALSWTKKDGMIVFGFDWPPTFANAVNSTGQIVGQNPPNNLCIGHATWWKNPTAYDLTPGVDLGALGTSDILGMDFSSAANGVNDFGQIVGWSTTGVVSAYNGTTSPVHAVLWSPQGAIQDLGTLTGDSSSAASKINLLGQVIGSSGDTLYTSAECMGEGYPLEVSGRPFIWSVRSGMQNLNALIRQNTGWVLGSANDINVWGQIVGEGTLNGQPHGFLLTPRNPFQPY
ncbi:MAG TPA: hypothetical protein VMG82_00380 [Candidatus Sulfotelmatobacter sp.]|nr:hypothetical protein [Candidatus Sulfotelmatobacter sp.]